MAVLLKREPRLAEPVDAFHRIDRMFEDWMRTFPFPRPFALVREFFPEDLIRVDEYQENGTLVVKAELPGIDPEEDVELIVTDRNLRIEAERREEEKVEEAGYVRQELRSGSFSRTLPLPVGVAVDDITATYRDGILEVRIPIPAAEPTKKIPVTKS
jgi:HSP20 family protein